MRLRDRLAAQVVLRKAFGVRGQTLKEGALRELQKRPTSLRRFYAANLILEGRIREAAEWVR